MGEDWAVKIEHLSKVYKIFDKPSDRVKEALHPFHKRYSKDFYALNDISLTIKKGETIGIIGKNGAGKSTLLKIITGVLTPSSGTVQVNGRVASLLELGAGFNPEMTGIENIYMNGTIMGYSREEMDARLQDIVDFADIGEFIYQPVKMYSSGMFARLAFAVNAFVEPDVLIIDEALSVGDAFFQNKCYRKLDEFREKGISILFVSHDMTSVQNRCSRVLWLEKGVQHMLGSCYDVCTAYYDARREIINEENKQYITKISNDNIAIKKTEIKISIPHIEVHEGSTLSDKVEIISAYIKDENGNYVSDVFARKTYTIFIVSHFYEKMNNIIIGFIMANTKGIVPLADNTYSNGNKKICLSVEKDSVIETSFKFIMPSLANGEYLISLAVAQGTQDTHIILTWINGAIVVNLEREDYALAELGWDIEVSNRSIGEFEFSDSI